MQKLIKLSDTHYVIVDDSFCELAKDDIEKRIEEKKKEIQVLKQFYDKI